MSRSHKRKRHRSRSTKSNSSSSSSGSSASSASSRSSSSSSSSSGSSSCRSASPKRRRKSAPAHKKKSKSVVAVAAGRGGSPGARAIQTSTTKKKRNKQHGLRTQPSTTSTSTSSTNEPPPNKRSKPKPKKPSKTELEASAAQEQQALQAQQLDTFRRRQTVQLLSDPSAPNHGLVSQLVMSATLRDLWGRTCQSTGSEDDNAGSVVTSPASVVAVHVEFQLFRLAGQSRTGFAYRQVVQDFLFNWTHNGTHIVNKYGTDIETLTTLTADQWAEGTVVERKRLAQAKRDADYQAVLEEKEEPVAGAKAFIPCPKCRSKDKKNPLITFETTWRAIQIRSCDEPATIFVKCLNPQCGEQSRIG